MAMAGIDEIVVALMGVLGDIDKLSTWTGIPAIAKFPATWLEFREPAAEYVTQDGGMTWHLDVVIGVQASDPMHRQTNLRPYLDPFGPKSIKGTIEDNPSLGLPGVYAAVLNIARIGRIEIAGAEPSSAWGARIPVDVYVSAV